MSTKQRSIVALSTLFICAQGLCVTAGAQAPETGSSQSRSETMNPATPGAAHHDMKNHDGMNKGKSGSYMQPVSAESFAKQAATIDKAEIELAQLAMKNSKDAAVRKYAEQMVKDHTATSAKLKTIAAKENLTLPQTLDAEHTAVKTKLSGLQGQDFDKEYSKEMAKGHDKALALFESAAQAPQISGDLKQFAASTLPKLREHKELAHDLHEKEGT